MEVYKTRKFNFKLTLLGNMNLFGSMKLHKIQQQIFLALLFTCIAIPTYASQEGKTTQDSKSVDLLTGSDTEKIQAIQKIIKDKDSSQIPNIIIVLKESQNPAVASQAAIALGVLGKKPESTTALKEKIESTEDGNVVYACILSLFNLHRKDSKKDPEVEAAIRYSLENRRNDPFVVDFLDKIKDKFIRQEG